MSQSTSRGTYITFKMGDELFAIDVFQVREVIDLSPIARVPTAPDYLRGVVNVRGKAVPVVDMKLRFGLPPTEPTVNTRVLILELDYEGEICVVGGLTDSVHDVIELDASDLEPPPRMGARWRSEAITGLARRENEFVMLLDVKRTFDLDGLHEELTSLPAAADESAA